ncbi:hypothetical protein KNE206_59790 [Kitasatospora sp. NE20-6]|uniref:hypothetical protein n=1 Tax=Kitasatospora sp. NE20-6 TaxID=2859066 RepID=UPI0034DC4E46
MSPVVVIALVALLAVAALAAVPPARRRIRSRRLRARFGPEYDRTVSSHGGDVARAEHELADRLALHRGLKLTALPAAERNAAEAEIRSLQSLFVDDPMRAAAEAERLLHRVLDRIGYPEKGRIEALSVDHAPGVAGYRAARAAVGTPAGPAAGTAGNTTAGTTAGTEELREALLATRALTREVLEQGHLPRPATGRTGSPTADDPAPDATEATRPAPAAPRGRRPVTH